ncbi:unnamed protein product, partial [Didymodactylos carnosus]
QLEHLVSLSLLNCSNDTYNYGQILFVLPKLTRLTLSGYHFIQLSFNLSLTIASKSNLEYLNISPCSLQCLHHSILRYIPKLKYLNVHIPQWYSDINDMLPLPSISTLIYLKLNIRRQLKHNIIRELLTSFVNLKYFSFLAFDVEFMNNRLWQQY